MLSNKLQTIASVGGGMADNQQQGSIPTSIPIKQEDFDVLSEGLSSGIGRGLLIPGEVLSLEMWSLRW